MRKYLILTGIFILIFVYWDMVYYPSSICAVNEVIINDRNAQVFSNLYPGSYRDSTLWATRDLAVYRYDEVSRCFGFENRLWFPIYTRQVLWNSKLLRSIFGRSRVGELYTLDSGTHLFFAGAHIYRYHENGRFHIVKNREAGIMRSGVTQDANGNVYYGEYTIDPSKTDIDIFIGKNDGETWELYFRFTDGEICHIHGVHYDRYRNTLWVTTGDSDDESTIGYFHIDDNKTFTKIGSGSQNWRAVSLLIDEQYIYWGMDSPDIQCFIYRYDVEKNEKEKMVPIDGPAYYTKQVNDGHMFLTTSVEGGSGEWNNNVSIWYSSDGETWEKYFEIEAVEKRQGHAIVSVPTGDAPPYKIFHFKETDKFNDALIIIN